MGKVHINEIESQDDISKSTKNPQICHAKAHETIKDKTSEQTSPLLNLIDRCQLLSRKKASNTIISYASEGNLCTENQIRFPDLRNERCLKAASTVIQKKMQLSVGVYPKSLSVSAPVSPVPSSRSPEMVEDSSRNQNAYRNKYGDEIHGKGNNTSQSFIAQRPIAKEQLQKIEQSSAMQRTGFLPHQERGSQSKIENAEHEKNTEDKTDVKCTKQVEGLQVKKHHVRSNSATIITSEDLTSISEYNRTRKPWNAWRRISVVSRNEREFLIGRMRASGSQRKKSFELWLAEKEIMKEEITTKTLEDGRLKKIAMEKLEEERKLRRKSYERWLAEKAAAAEELREIEKKKEIEKKTTEEELQMRKIEAERKYEKWMKEKHDEELRKEEELQRLLEEQWKVMQETNVRRKSAPVKTTFIK